MPAPASVALGDGRLALSRAQPPKLVASGLRSTIVDAALARVMVETFLEVIIASEVTDEAREVLVAKKRRMRENRESIGNPQRREHGEPGDAATRRPRVASAGWSYRGRPLGVLKVAQGA